MKAKKMFGILLAGSMAISAVAGLAACGGGGGGGDDTPDTNEYYVVGDGGGSLKVSGWATEHKPELKLTKDGNKNVFTIELELYAGDEFQIVHTPTIASFWEGQMGFGILKNPTNASGDEVFSETGQYGGNIGVNVGFDGLYKFTLNTFPKKAADNNITWELLEAYEMTTVTYYDGETVLNTQPVKKGAALTEADLYTPAEKLFMNFDGWLTEKTDATLYTGGTVSAALNLYAKYTEMANDGYVEDTNAYYLVGDGEGDLKASGWKISGTEDDPLPAKLNLKKDTAYTRHNVYTIEVELYAGDQFKIAFDGTWDTALNINSLMDEDVGTSAFEGDDNITLKSGRDGIYKFTLVTDGATKDIYWELVESKDPLTVDYYLVGTYATADGDDVAFRSEPGDWTIHFVEGEDNKWTCTVTITTNDYIPAKWDDNPDGSVHAAALKVKLNGAFYGVAAIGTGEGQVADAEHQNGTSGGANFLLAEGTYKITFNAETKVISWTVVTEPAE